MSRYVPAPDYRVRDRSRSPPRYADRRASAASLIDNRPLGPMRSASDAPRGPRSQYDSARPLPPAAGPGPAPRPAYPSLRDAPPLGSGDRGRPFREREFDRRERIPSPRDRSPRGFKDPRDLPPRDAEYSRQRRGSRDGPLPPSSTYPDSLPPPSGPPFRGGYQRGRGRGDHFVRGAPRGGRGAYDDRPELIRRNMPSPPPPRPGWARDRSRDSRDADRRDDRRYDRREDDRRPPPEWVDRERERDMDRPLPRREPPSAQPSRLEARNSNDSMKSLNAANQQPQAPRINPDRLALIESAGGDVSGRRPSMQQDAQPPREVKREQPETPAYLNARAATTANRYSARGSSSPTQAPPVPAFGALSFAPQSNLSGSASQPFRTSQMPKSVPEVRKASPPPPSPSIAVSVSKHEARPAPPPDAPTAPKGPPPAPKADLANIPPTAPRGPRAQETDDAGSFGSRLQPARSSESVGSQMSNSQALPPVRLGTFGQQSVQSSNSLPTLVQPVSPRPVQSRFADLGAPTGPRAGRPSPAQSSVSPRPPFASPKSDVGAQPAATNLPRASTPPPSAPTGPRSRPYSVSPKVAPTAPRGSRIPPVAPRALERGPAPVARAPDRAGAPQTLLPPLAPRAAQWNQWKRPGIPSYNDRIIPAKRDVSGEEKAKFEESKPTSAANETSAVKTQERKNAGVAAAELKSERSMGDDMDIDKPKRQASLMSGHSAARSFFGKPVNSIEEDENDTSMSEAGQDIPSTSEEEESEADDDALTLFQAKFDRQKRQLEAKLVDLSQPHYRPMSPLEAITRLVRISMHDVQKFKEEREREMDIDEAPALHPQHGPPRNSRSSESVDDPDVLTPQDDDDRHIAVHSSGGSTDDVRRIRRPSPEPILLPYLLKDGAKSLSHGAAFTDTINRDETSEKEIMDALVEKLDDEEDAHHNADQIFAQEYKKWREECEDLDRAREEQEKLERQQSIEPALEVNAPVMQPLNPFEGSRRLHKFNSEYEFEQVLKQSEETARIEQERQDRETKKNQADMEKEAIIPDHLTEFEVRRTAFVDTNRYRDPEDLTVVFSYEPPIDDFTESEQHIFIAAFKESPKKWGEIASLLPGRTYEDCIRHYYANKWDGRFRDNRTKKLKAGGRRGRGGPRGPRGRLGGLMADLARSEHILSIEAMSEKGRPRRAAAPTTFGEKEAESKAALLGQSPAKKLGANGKPDGNGDGEKPGKRQKRNGDKPGRKSKAGQPLANLAAAPQGSPAKQLMQREDQLRAQKLEDASLLASLQTGHHGIFNADPQIIFTQDRMMQPIGGLEDPDRPNRLGQGPTSKQSASSYWSVPEQQDFVKYIGHFGRDFAAIAAHMGTKTQTMIKNHYMRQVEGGNKPDLERSAIEAEERRHRGEDPGPAPAPTPIQKRKYESVPSSTQQRTLAPNGDAMDVDEPTPAPPSRTQMPKHVSPPQYQAQPRMNTSTQNTPIPTPRVVASPLPATTAPTPMPMPAHMKTVQHPLSSRLTFMSDPRPESRQNAQPPSFMMRGFEDSSSRAQPQQQQNRPTSDIPNQRYITQLVEEQQKALRLQQEQQSPPEHMEHLQNQSNLFRSSVRGSPLIQPVQHPVECKPIIEERGPSPGQRIGFMSSAFPRAQGPSPFPMGLPHTGRSVFQYSPSAPPKREEQKPPPMSSAPPTVTPPKPANSEPKRSNVMSLLNNDDEPQPPKRDTLPPITQRTSSPVPRMLQHEDRLAGNAATQSLRRESSFGQSSLPQSQFSSRNPFSQPSSTPATGPPTPKREPSFGVSLGPQKSDWPPRNVERNESQRQSNPTLEREVRPYFQHGGHRSSLLGSLGQPRANPSPPPLPSLAHSRTPSLTAQTGQQAREQQHHPSLLGQQVTQGLQPNPYSSHSLPPFSQPPPSASQNQPQHAHRSSVGGPFPMFHQRGLSRDEQQMRQEQQMHEREREQREREDRDSRWRQHEFNEVEHRRREADQNQRVQMDQRRQQQQHEQERRMIRGQAPRPLQPPGFGAPPFGGNGSVGLRRQSQMEVEMAMREEARQDHEQRQQELMQEGEYRRRAEIFRHTPLGGGFGLPQQQPPPGARR